MSDYGLSSKTVACIEEVLARFPEVQRAILFGSRAKGTFRRGSDIDLVLEGEGVDWQLLGRIEMALDDTMLPYSFSLIELSEKTDAADAADADIAEHVRRVGKLFYSADTSPSAATEINNG